MLTIFYSFFTHMHVYMQNVSHSGKKKKKHAGSVGVHKDDLEININTGSELLYIPKIKGKFYLGE